MKLIKAGQESFRSITRSYYKGSICAILAYDISNKKSFTNSQQWLREIKEYANEKVIVIFIGNKSDLANKFFRSNSEEKSHLMKLQDSLKKTV